MKGRGAELRTLERTITAARPTRIALVGPGGSGKSMLAAALGHRLRAAFGGRIDWFRSAAWGFYTLSEMLALRFGTGLGEGRVDRLRRFLSRGPERLIVLDNHEDDRAMETLFERFYGLNMQELTGIDYDEIEQLTKQFRDIIFDFPFQLPQDFIFLGRTLSMLAGLATGLDPNFSPIAGLEPFARRLIGAEAGNLVNQYAREAAELITIALALPRRAQRHSSARMQTFSTFANKRSADEGGVHGKRSRAHRRNVEPVAADDGRAQVGARARGVPT